eukprot:c5619_g1_i3.p1 GENE.c5619_g1_i3~~c5619_g1_i3.p1  ORF type:complete len:154 (+),score=42.95 c5619_g1_i3:298-759(+)
MQPQPSQNTNDSKSPDLQSINAIQDSVSRINEAVEKEDVEGVLREMRSGKSSSTIQERACVGIWKMTRNEDTLAKFGKGGAIELILEAMKNHSGFHGVQMHGSGALRNLAEDDDNYAKIRSSNAVELIRLAMQNHSSKVLLRRYCEDALARIV